LTIARALSRLIDATIVDNHLQSPERRGHKLTDPVEAADNARHYSPLDPRLPGSMTIDVTDLAPEVAAARIFDHVNSRDSKTRSMFS
jgi:hypothetical protein